jgi:hypothetical protein
VADTDILDAPPPGADVNLLPQDALAPTPTPQPPPNWADVTALPEFQALPPEKRAQVVHSYADTVRDHALSLGGTPDEVNAAVEQFRTQRINEIYPPGDWNAGPPPAAPAAPADALQEGSMPNLQALRQGKIEQQGGQNIDDVLSGLTTPLASPQTVKTTIESAQPLVRLAEALPGTLGKVATGATEGAAETTAGLTSPLNIVLLGTGALGKVMQRLISAGFSAQMLSHVPQQWNQFVAETDPEKKTKTAVGLVSNLLFGVAAGGHAAGVHLPTPVSTEHVRDVPDSLLQVAAADPNFARSAQKPVLNAVYGELARRGLRPVPAEQFTEAQTKLEAAHAQAEGLRDLAPETANAITERAQAEFTQAIAEPKELVTPEDGKRPAGLKPAFRTADGQVFDTNEPTHFGAAEAAHKAGADLENGDYGFVTDKGEFLDRAQAYERVKGANGEKPVAETPSEPVAETPTAETPSQPVASPVAEPPRAIESAPLQKPVAETPSDTKPVVSTGTPVEAIQKPVEQMSPQENFAQKEQAQQGQASTTQEGAVAQPISPETPATEQKGGEISGNSETRQSQNKNEASTQRQKAEVLSESAGPAPASPTVELKGHGEVDLLKAKEKIAKSMLDNVHFAVETGRDIGELTRERKAAYREAKSARIAAEQPVSETVPQSPTDLAHTVAKDLGRSIAVPKGTTALRVTDVKGRQTVVRAADLRGSNILFNAGPYQLVEAGTVGRKNEFVPSKEPVGVKEPKSSGQTRSPIASGITAPGLAARVAEYLRPKGLEDEESLPATLAEAGAKNEFHSGVQKDVAISEELPQGESSETNAPLEETTGTPADQSSLKASSLAHEQASGSAVASALRERGDAAVPPDLQDQVGKRYATLNKILNERGVTDPIVREKMHDILRDDLVANAKAGDPFNVQTASGKTVPYSITARMVGTAAQPFGKLTNELKRHENQNVRGEDADLVSELTAAPKDTSRYHEAVNYVLDATDNVVSDFANRQGFEGHSPDAIAAATGAVLQEQGFGKRIEGRPSKETQDILANPNFRPAVQKSVLARIADAVQQHFDASVLDNVRLTNNNDAVSSALSGIAKLFEPGAMERVGKVARGWFGAIAGRTLPRFTAFDREVGEKGARYISSQIAAEPMADVFSAKVLEGLNISAGKLGAALSEDNLRDVKAQNLAKAIQAEHDGNNELAAEYKARADNTASMVGKGKPFRTEEEYQQFLSNPDTQEAINRYKSLWDSQVNPIYRAAQRIDPEELLPARGIQTGARVNLYALQPGEKAVSKVTGAPPGGLTNTLRRKSPFAVEAKGTAAHYETDIREMMRNTFGRQLSIANYNQFIDSMVDKGLAQIGKPGQKIEIDGEPAVSFPLQRRTIITTKDGQTSVFPANESVYVKASLAPEFRSATNVDPSGVSSVLSKYVFRPINNAALYGLTDATVHVSNLATALFTKPAVAGGTLSDSLLSAFGRADVPVTLTKAVIKGFQDNREQMAELAAIGAARAQSRSATFGLGWSNKMIHWADKTTRLVLDDAYKQLIKEGLVKDTETNRREFVNSVGQYNRRASTGLARTLKDAGIAPFVVAGANFNRLGIRTVGLQAGVQHTSALAHVITSTNIATKWVGAAALIGITNYLLTHDKGGGVLGRPGVPVGNIDTGKTDENDKPLSIAASDLIGLGRGLRATGIRGYAQAKRNQLTEGDARDAAGRDIVNTAISPFAGPAVRAGSAAIFNRAPGIGTPPINHIVAPTGDDTQKSQVAHNILRAIADVNPAVAAYLDRKENPSLPTADVLKRQLPRFTLRPSNSVEMMDAYPQIVHKAQVNSYIEDTIYTARRLKPADRTDYVERQVEQLPPEDQKHLRDQLKRRKVNY